jgi:hypothetical protein
MGYVFCYFVYFGIAISPLFKGTFLLRRAEPAYNLHSKHLIFIAVSNHPATAREYEC